MANNQINIEVRGKIATLKSQNFTLVGGNSDYTVFFDFDEDWSKHLVKTALFVFGDRAVPKIFQGNACEGVAIDNSHICYVGVFTGDIITTTPAQLECVKQSITDIGGIPQEPNPNVYNQIIGLLNELIEGGVSNLLIDQNYNRKSRNAQSGVAVAEAIKGVTWEEVANVGTDTIAWNGDTTDRDNYENQYFVSSAEVTLGDLANGGVIVVGGQEIPFTSENAVTNNIGISLNIPQIDNAVRFIDNSMASSLGISTGGVYFNADQRGTVTSLKIHGFDGFDLVEKIPSKYLPDDVATEQTVSEKISEVKTEIDKTLTQQGQQISQNSTAIEENATAISNIATEQGKQSEQITANSNEIASIKEQQSTQNYNIEQNTEDITAIKAEQTTQNQEIASVKSQAERLAASKQDNLVFDGEYNAETNQVATVHTVAEKVAEIVASAPEDFDTLREIADYISSDKTGAAEINNKLAQHTTAIDENATDIAENKLAIEEVETKLAEDYVDITNPQTIGGRKTLTDRLHTRDIYVGGYFDEDDVWQDTPETSSSLRVSGTVKLTGEVHAENASFHTHHMDVKGELKVSGDARFDHDVRMTHSLRVDAKADIREGATIRGTLDMKGNDVKNVQSLEVEGTLQALNDVRIIPNTNRADQVKLSDALNEALDYTFKNRVQINGKEIATVSADYPTPLDKALYLIENTSASIIDLGEEVITYDWTTPIVLNQSVTFKGSKKNKATLIFNLSGVEESEECVLFRVTSPEITVGFDNVNIIVQTDVEGVSCRVVEFIPSETSEGLDYTLSDDGTYYICSGIGTCTSKDIKIPSYYKGLPITDIADDAFNGSNLTSVVISEGITHIGSYAFQEANSLVSVHIPNSVISIGDLAFEGCYSLVSVLLGENSNLASIGEWAFNGCSALPNIFIPNSVTHIGERAFNSCANITINCEASAQPTTWNIDWNPDNRPVVWSAVAPIVEPFNTYPTNLNISKCNTFGTVPIEWHTDNCNISITESNLSNSKFYGNAQTFYYYNNSVSNVDFSHLTYAESNIDLRGRNLLINGEKVVTENELNSKIGDISMALDELHAYSQSLVSGGEA